jgi:RNA polymerase sigma-70 factor (ECF subfamily)
VGIEPGLFSRPDEELVRLARDGSEEAFVVIVERYHASLVQQCARVVGNTEAEDVVQDTLLKAHRAIRDGYEVRQLGPWLRRIAHNIAINTLQASRRRPLVAERDYLCDRGTDQASGVRERLQEVVAAVTELPNRQREAIVMQAFEGRSYEEISARLATTDAAVRQLLNRARAQLRAKLAAVNVLEPVISWVRSGDNGAAAAGAGLVSGGCAAAVKMCAVAVIPAVTAGLSGPPAKQRVVRKHPSVAVVAVPGARTSGVDHPRPALVASRASPPGVFTRAPRAARQPAGTVTPTAQSKGATPVRAVSRTLGAAPPPVGSHPPPDQGSGRGPQQSDRIAMAPRQPSGRAEASPVSLTGHASQEGLTATPAMRARDA